MTAVLPLIDADRCEGCGECVAGCAKSAVALQNGLAVIVRPEGCTYCAECEALCPRQAISCPFEIVYGE